MSLEHLWAGWRLSYVTGADAAHADPPSGDGGEGSCVFCRIAASGPPSAENGVLWRGESVYAVLNAYPYAPGHLMVLPNRHVAELEDVTDAESHELWAVLRAANRALRAALGPEGVNLGANLGRAAGAGLPRHLHLHAVPRWSGDTNFMTTVANTRVLPEALSATWERLTAVWG